MCCCFVLCMTFPLEHQTIKLQLLFTCEATSIFFKLKIKSSQAYLFTLMISKFNSKAFFSACTKMVNDAIIHRYNLFLQGTYTVKFLVRKWRFFSIQCIRITTHSLTHSLLIWFVLLNSFIFEVHTYPWRVNFLYFWFYNLTSNSQALQI